MKKGLMIFTILIGQAHASSHIVTTYSAPRIQATPDFDPSITSAYQIVNELKTSAVFRCGHINPKQVGEAQVEISEIRTPGRANRYLLEVHADFEC